ncbi:WD40 repeat domain-containing protein [Herbidospora cretacea]|uniref:WD40 repeat domain-containing protein n=1 Tax=Herbidospora cretacea TaxID=28444 RepID=UPI0009ED67E2
MGWPKPWMKVLILRGTGRALWPHKRVWDAHAGTELIQLPHSGEVRAVSFSPDGRRLATADSDRSAWLWDADSRSQLAQLAHDRVVRSVVFSPDGSRLATPVRTDRYVYGRQIHAHLLHSP